MTHQTRSFTLAALWALPVWAALLFYATLTEQPDPETAFADFANYVTTNQFLLTHIVGSIVGAAIGSIGFIGLMLYLQDSKDAGKAIAAMVAFVVGNILMASTYGIAAFAEPAMGRMYQAGQQNAVEFFQQVNTAPYIGTALGGLLLFIVAGLFAGIAIARSGRLPRLAGWLVGLTMTGFALGLFFPPIVQTVSSSLLFIATLAVAWSASRKNAGQAVTVGMTSEI